jgi:hypothetical protein
MQAARQVHKDLHTVLSYYRCIIMKSIIPFFTAKYASSNAIDTIRKM